MHDPFPAGVSRQMSVGDAVGYVDSSGKAYSALVLHVWANCLNVAYVSADEEDSFGNLVIKVTSVPYQQEGMSGNYIVAQ